MYSVFNGMFQGSNKPANAPLERNRTLPCFLSSPHACKGLVVNRLLSSLNLEIPCGDVNKRLVAWFGAPWFTTTTKGNTISLWWPLLRKFTQYTAEHQKPLESLSVTCCTREPHCGLVRSISRAYKSGVQQVGLRCFGARDWRNIGVFVSNKLGIM